MWRLIQMMDYFFEKVTWYLRRTQMQVSTMKLKLGAELEPTFSLWKSTYSSSEWCSTNHCTNHQVCDGVSSGSWTDGYLHHRQEYGSYATHTGWNGMVATKIFHTDRQLNRCRIRKQDHHKQSYQVIWLETLVAMRQRVSIPVQLLLGSWTRYWGWLQHKAPPSNLSCDEETQQIHGVSIFLFIFISP